MVSAGASPWGPSAKVRKVVSTRARPSSRVNQPRSIAMPMPESPNPTAAIEHFESGVERSRTSPFRGSASTQK